MTTTSTKTNAADLNVVPTTGAIERLQKSLAKGSLADLVR